MAQANRNRLVPTTIRIHGSVNSSDRQGEARMSRKMAFAAALVVGFWIGSLSVAEEPSVTGAGGGGGQGALGGVPTSVSGATLPPVKKPSSATPDIAKEQTERIERGLKELVDLQFVDTPLSD